MGLPEELRERAETIYQAMQEMPPAMDGYFRPPRWWGQWVSSILIAAGDNDITYITLRTVPREGDERAFDIEALAFTDKAVIHATGLAREDVDSLESPMVRAIPLREMASLQVWSDAATSDEYGGPPWPGNVTATLAFKSGEQYTVPFRRSRDQTERGRLQEVVKGLARNL